jgi:peptidoglycan/xylan/chitin deacetylase (PgdA/CDA1 family)
MGAFKNALVGAGIATVAAAHGHHHSKRSVPVDGSIILSCTTPGTVALTFDDGPYEYTQSIVDALTTAGHKATFFQNGKSKTRR